MDVEDSLKSTNSKPHGTRRTTISERQGEAPEPKSSDKNKDEDEEGEKSDRKHPSSGSSDMARRTPTVADPPTNPSWFTPKRLNPLTVFLNFPISLPLCGCRLRRRIKVSILEETQDAVGLLECPLAVIYQAFDIFFPPCSRIWVIFLSFGGFGMFRFWDEPSMWCEAWVLWGVTLGKKNYFWSSLVMKQFVIWETLLWDWSYCCI